MTTAEPARFYFDLASPYAYLASARVDRLLGSDTEWRPVLVGAIQRQFRRTSWGATPALRAAGIAEIERRAADYGLAPIRWPDPYPANSLTAMRAVTWAAARGAVREFARSAYAIAFAEGVDLTAREPVLEAARRCGLDASELAGALDDPALKAELRTATDEAIAIGVYGVPTVDAGGLLWWGDGQLEAAAAHHRR